MPFFSDWDLFDPEAAPRKKRPIRVDTPEVVNFPSSDGTPLRLTRYQGGSRGPVMLVHCIGVSSLMYSIDTIQTNLLEFLYENGFDVWLLDFRFSIDLPSHANQATMDDVATQDYPASVAKVRQLTGANTIQVVAHGVGSSTFTMAMLAGLEGVRSAVCSQVSTHLIVPLINRIKTGLYLSTVLSRVGFKSMTAYVDTTAGWKSKLYDRILTTYPIQAEERCDSPVCRRITSIYGALYKHDQLNEDTHHVLHEMFGKVNFTAMRQLSLITRKNHLVDARGKEKYLTNAEKLGVPIAFIHGSDNDCVLPESTETTVDLLRSVNGNDLYQRHEISGYGHVDCMFGKDASVDVFPHILDHLLATGA
jgi:cholesterol oxidase